MLAGHAPVAVGAPDHERAGVAVVLRDGPVSAEVLLIERAIHDGDPWSGHMAFPGGRMEPADGSTRVTAARETHEEVGVDLSRSAYLGAVDELVGNRRVSPRLVVTAHAFHVTEPPCLALERREVQNAFWFPLAELHAEHRRVEHVIPELPRLRFPGVAVGVPGRHVVWGLTFRFLERMLALIERPFPARWGNLADFVDASGTPHPASDPGSDPPPLRAPATPSTSAPSEDPSASPGGPSASTSNPGQRSTGSGG